MAYVVGRVNKIEAETLVKAGYEVVITPLTALYAMLGPFGEQVNAPFQNSDIAHLPEDWQGYVTYFIDVNAVSLADEDTIIANKPEGYTLSAEFGIRERKD